jgi:hypothetical protein
MIKEPFAAIGRSFIEVFKRPAAIGFLALLYLLTLLAVWGFFSTGVGSVWQLALSLLTAVGAPLFLLLLFTGAAEYGAGHSNVGTLSLKALKDVWKIFLISVPMILLAVLTIYLLNKLQKYSISPTAESRPHLWPASPTRSVIPPPLRWQDVLVSSLRLGLLGIFFPVMTISLWINAARYGFIATLKEYSSVIGRSLSAISILTYVVGLLLFAVLPFFVIFTRTEVTNGWLELIIFGLRILVAFLLTLIGFIVTVRAFASVQGNGGDASASVVEPGPTPQPAASV